MLNEKDHKADFSFITRILEDNKKAGYEHGYSVGYNKAIDDFADLISRKSHIDLDEDYVDGGSTIITTKEVFELAEQLKNGGSNANRL